ncbi:MAG: hypothetical protein G01um101425_864 [Candidatus Peregrinibacteria bacterium Gr01-1014_25]|nr:MAG: hypothetical protein G01um101425_864 [Candidatus Peregrinibacteria bacterium Gr01-1014_25]
MVSQTIAQEKKETPKKSLVMKHHEHVLASSLKGWTKESDQTKNMLDMLNACERLLSGAKGNEAIRAHEAVDMTIGLISRVHKLEQMGMDLQKTNRELLEKMQNVDKALGKPVAALPPAKKMTPCVIAWDEKEGKWTVK